MIRPICLYGHSALRQPSIPVYDRKVIDVVVRDLFDTMEHAGGVGLAAPQIGENLMVFVMDPTPMANNNEEAQILKKFRMPVINPQIIDVSKETWVFEEGCLSIPGLRLPIERPYTINVKFMDMELNEVTMKLVGIVARIFLHEYDHLMGILIVDYFLNSKNVKGAVANTLKKMIKSHLRKIQNGEIVPEYECVY